MIVYNRHTHTFDAMINGVVVACEDSYLAAELARISVKQAIIKAISYLADLMTPPPPPAAPVALSNPKKAKKTPRVCTCVACRCIAAEGIHYCAAGREWYVFDNNILVGIFSRKERLEAEDALNNARYQRLRQAA